MKKNIDIQQQKARLRSVCAEEAKTLEDEAAQESDAMILAQLTALPEYLSAIMVFCFVSLPDEVDTRAFCRRAIADGKRLAVPVAFSGGRMQARLVCSMQELVGEDRFGIPVPPDSARRVLPEEIDFAVIPGVSFSADCARLGRGGGYYDRFLADFGGFSAGLCRKRCLSGAVPEGEHDRRVSAVVTETQIYYAGADWQKKNYAGTARIASSRLGSVVAAAE